MYFHNMKEANTVDTIQTHILYNLIYIHGNLIETISLHCNYLDIVHIIIYKYCDHCSSMINVPEFLGSTLPPI